MAQGEKNIRKKEKNYNSHHFFSWVWAMVEILQTL